MEQLGVEPERVILSHMDRNPDLFLHTDLVASGAYLVYDGVSRTKYWPDSTIIDLIVELFCDGYGDRLMLAMDMGPSIDVDFLRRRTRHGLFVETFHSSPTTRRTF